MGCKYMADCAKYPFKGYYEHDIQDNHLIPFLFKLIKAAKTYQIINIQYRNIKNEFGRGKWEWRGTQGKDGQK